MVADHQHVHMLIERVDGVGHGWVGRARQKVGLADHPQNIRRMSAACALGVKGAQRTAFGSCNCVFNKSRFIQGVGVNGNLRVGCIGNV